MDYSVNNNNNISFFFNNAVPIEIKERILKSKADNIISNVVNKEIFSNNDIKQAGREILTLCVCTDFAAILAGKRNKIHTIFTLYNKYSAYNEHYLWPLYNPSSKRSNLSSEKSMGPYGNPQLLDLLSLGLCPPLDVSSCVFSEERENDLQLIIKYMPKSFLCNLGALRCRELIKPIVYAAYNPHVPVFILEILFKNGANPNETLLVDRLKTHVLVDLRLNNPERYEKIKPIFEKYGAVEEEF